MRIGPLLVLSVLACSRRRSNDPARDSCAAILAAAPALPARAPLPEGFRPSKDASTSSAYPQLAAELDAYQPDKWDSFVLLIRLGELGESAHDLTPALVNQARRASWVDRYFFVQAMAAVADSRAVPYLIESLASSDWRVTLAAERALGRQRETARAALPALATVERTHWLPRARQWASETCAQIDGRNILTSPLGHAPEPTEATCLEESTPAADGWKLARDFVAQRPTVVSFTRIPEGSFVSHRVDDGILVGVRLDEGEGALFWIADGKKEVAVRHGGVFAIVPVKWGLLMLQHSWGDTVCMLERDAGGRWTARPILELPGEPVALRPMPQGELSVATTKGTVLFGPGGAVQRFECRVPAQQIR